MNSYEKRIEKWAYKFFAEANKNIDITKENLKKYFKGCIRLPKNYMYPDIINKIKEMKDKGIKFNCEE